MIWTSDGRLSKGCYPDDRQGDRHAPAQTVRSPWARRVRTSIRARESRGVPAAPPRERGLPRGGETLFRCLSWTNAGLDPSEGVKRLCQSAASLRLSRSDHISAGGHSLKNLRHPATILAALALFVALGSGAAVAGGLVSGKQLVDHSVQEWKLTGRAISSLRGQRGPTGSQGPAGPQGPKGATGLTGPDRPERPRRPRRPDRADRARPGRQAPRGPKGRREPPAHMARKGRPDLRGQRGPQGRARSTRSRNHSDSSPGPPTRHWYRPASPTPRARSTGQPSGSIRATRSTGSRNSWSLTAQG